MRVLEISIFFALPGKAATDLSINWKDARRRARFQLKRDEAFFIAICVCVCVCLSIGKCNGIFSRLLGVASEDREGLADNLPDATNSPSTVDTSRTRRLHAKWFVKSVGVEVADGESEFKQ